MKFVEQCKTIAKNLETMVEIKECQQCGWAVVAFMTDKFGGTYVNLHYDLNTGKITNWYGHKDARDINDVSFLSYFIREERDKMLAARNLQEIYERLNEEY